MMSARASLSTFADREKRPFGETKSMAYFTSIELSACIR
jgi:hypothetical protein